MARFISRKGLVLGLIVGMAGTGGSMAVLTGMASATDQPQGNDVITLTPATATPAPAPTSGAPARSSSSRARVPLDTGPGCADGYVCFWGGTDYQGHKVRASCAQFSGFGWYLIGGDVNFYHSTKNACATKYHRTGNASVVTSCNDAGGQHANIDDSDRFMVGTIPTC